MTREISKGRCAFCQGEFSKSGMTRHLESCKQRAAIQAEVGSRQKVQKTRAFHLVVEGYRLPMYWMHLEVMASAMLETLDHFLRDTWLECCGHLSEFTIGGMRYSADVEMYQWDTGRKSIQVQLDKVLSPGQRCSYEYDFGSTTELMLKVVSEREVVAKGEAIQVLARNNPPFIPCDVCGKPVTSICTQCSYEDEGYLCETCAQEHACGEEMLSLVVNSPRAGVCGYPG